MVHAFEVRSETAIALDSAFLAAYLVTQSDARAEQMVCLAIESANSSNLDGRRLLAKTLSLSLALNRNVTDADCAGSKNWSLPEQLESVMELEPSLRYCFVTRVIFEFPLRDCVDLLQMDAVTITRSLIEATQRLCRRLGKCSEAHQLLPLNQVRNAGQNEMYETHGPAMVAASFSSACLHAEVE